MRRAAAGYTRLVFPALNTDTSFPQPCPLKLAGWLAASGTARGPPQIQVDRLADKSHGTVAHGCHYAVGMPAAGRNVGWIRTGGTVTGRIRDVGRLAIRNVLDDVR